VPGARLNGAGSSGAGSGDQKLSSGERKILTALVQYPQGHSKVQVAVLTGYAVSGVAASTIIWARCASGACCPDGESSCASPRMV
jgi:hypothetical protein